LRSLFASETRPLSKTAATSSRIFRLGVALLGCSRCSGSRPRGPGPPGIRRVVVVIILLRRCRSFTFRLIFLLVFHGGILFATAFLTTLFVLIFRLLFMFSRGELIQ